MQTHLGINISFFCRSDEVAAVPLQIECNKCIYTDLQRSFTDGKLHRWSSKSNPNSNAPECSELSWISYREPFANEFLMTVATIPPCTNLGCMVYDEIYIAATHFRLFIASPVPSSVSIVSAIKSYCSPPVAIVWHITQHQAGMVMLPFVLCWVQGNESRYVLPKIEECTSAAEVAKSVDVLSAKRWLANVVIVI